MMRTAALCCAVLLACSACGDDGFNANVDGAVDSATPGPVRLADLVIEAPGASGSGFGDPMNAVNGVRGGGPDNGSLDVYSLAFPPALNQSITLGRIEVTRANLEHDLGQLRALVDAKLDVVRRARAKLEQRRDQLVSARGHIVRRPLLAVGVAAASGALLAVLRSP